MPKLFSYDDTSHPVYIPVPTQQRKRYGFFKFVFDCFMVFITWGFWLIWIFVREMRK